MDDMHTPVTLELKEGARVTIRWATLDDVPAIDAHFRGLPPRDRALRCERRSE